MALRAGYYGIKRAFRDKLEQIIPIGASKDNQLATSMDIDDVYIANAVTGAQNLLKNTASGKSQNNVTFVVNADKSVTVSTTEAGASANASLTVATHLSVKKGQIISGCPDGGSSTKYEIQAFKGESPYTTLTHDYGNGGVISADDNNVTVNIIIRNGEKITTPITFYPMLSVNSRATYAPYTMTNQELTASADDQKTAINAIITAATGAADFAEFKAAMEAITPVTRSLSMAAAPEELVKEEITEEPVVEKKTTKKKSTAKAETQEEV